MGNTQTKDSNKLDDIVDEIASKYILKQNFKDLKNLCKL